MKYFEKGLNRLIIIGMNDLACDAVRFCKANDIDVVVISGPRFRDLPSMVNGFSTCYERMESLQVEINELVSLDCEYLSKHLCCDCAVFSFDSPFIIKQEIIDMFDGVIFNEHGAHLPNGKGGGGFSWRIMEDDREGNVLFHLLVKDIDAGPVVYQSSFVFPEACRKPLEFMVYQYEKNTLELTKFIEMLRDNEDFQQIEQDIYFESYMPRLHTPSQAFIDWSWRVEYIQRFILAFSEPYEGAKAFINGKKIYLYDAYIDAKQIHTHPFKFGVIFSVYNGGLRVAANNGTLVVSKYKIEDDYRPQLGDRLHTPISIIDDIFSQRVIYSAEGMKKRN